VTRSNPTKQRYPSFSGLLMVDTVRGKVRVRAWPKKRGRPKSAAVRSQNKWFKSATQIMNQVDPSQMKIAIEAAKGTGFYPRDLLMNAISGGIIEVVFPDGVVLTSSQYFLEDVVFQGARVVRTSNLTIPNATLFTVDFESPILQTTPIWDAGNPERLTVPVGVSVVSVESGLQSLVNQSGLWVHQIEDQTGVRYTGAGSEFFGFRNIYASTGPIPVVAGDYFVVKTFTVGARQLTAGPGVFFSMTLLGVS